MKKIVFLPLLFFAIGLFSQSAALSTFEEMWIVKPNYPNLEMKKMTALAPESMTYEKLASARSLTELNKVVPNTPFLILMFDGIDGESRRKVTSENGSIAVTSLFGPSRQLNGEAEWVAVTKGKMGYQMIIPTNQPEKLKDYIMKNDLMVTDETGQLRTMSIKDIRIENGTYGKTK